MSRIGNRPVAIPEGVEVTIADNEISVKGKLGQLSMPIHADAVVEKNENEIVVKPANEAKPTPMWATTRALINNLVEGVSKGFSKTLEINGVGYKAQVQGRVVKLNLGFSHDVNYELPEGVEAKAEKPTVLVISGADKQKVGQVAADIRAWRKPEPYKGKGVKYSDEVIIRKEGKKK
ncbi:MAG: 50S ribosomal protein L6 [Alphaproteobacteria bacterium]|jgi:large subunit ribosomal protein L6|nr:50S ribosomal protein L6 [Alphaproteobacteria bacterium]MCV6599522.1 50S ribosomal protein L6 [Alphaproteobacteria bacterium]